MGMLGIEGLLTMIEFLEQILSGLNDGVDANLIGEILIDKVHCQAQSIKENVDQINGILTDAQDLLQSTASGLKSLKEVIDSKRAEWSANHKGDEASQGEGEGMYLEHLKQTERVLAGAQKKSKDLGITETKAISSELKVAEKWRASALIVISV